MQTRTIAVGTGLVAAAFLIWIAGRAGSPSDRAAPASGTGAPKAATGKAAGRLPVPVVLATATETEMPVIITAPGTVEPLASVAIKPRTDGQIVEVAVTEGSMVKPGDVLFRLDDRLIRAQIRQAKANIAKDLATLADADGNLGRKENLVRQKVSPQALADTAKATVEALKASIEAGRAQLEVQETQLDYLTIRAPIAGKTGNLNAKLGSAVRTADAPALVTINQIKPILVVFSVPQSRLASLRRAMATGATADVLIAGDEPVHAPGTMSFIDNQLDKSTGTVLAKVVVNNEAEELWPGQAATVTLHVEKRKRFVSVPVDAVLPSARGMVVWVVDAENTAAPRSVKQEGVVGQIAYLSTGLKGGERVVVDGQLRLAPGATIVERTVGRPKIPPPAASDAGKPANAAAAPTRSQ